MFLEIYVREEFNIGIQLMFKVMHTVMKMQKAVEHSLALKKKVQVIIKS